MEHLSRYICTLDPACRYSTPKKVKAPKAKAFTFVELLVVIGLIAVLIGILLPTLSRARQYSQAIKCRSQLHQIALSVQFYVTNNRGYLAHSYGNLIAPGNGWTTLDPVTGLVGLIDSTSSNAYWGVAYARYLLPASTLAATGDASTQIIQAACGIWHCPSTLSLEPASDDPTAPLSYAINGIITGTKAPPNRKFSNYQHASEVIFCQDSIEQEITASNYDSLSNFGSGNNLRYFRPGGQYYVLDDITWGVNEYYRHHNQCNVLWLDGHVDSLRLSTGSDVPQTAYQPLYLYNH